MDKVYCEVCKAHSEYSCEAVKLLDKINGVSITYRYVVTRCIKCNNEVYVLGIALENAKSRKEAYYKKKLEI